MDELAALTQTLMLLPVTDVRRSDELAALELQVAEIEASIGRSDCEEAIRLVGALQLVRGQYPGLRLRGGFAEARSPARAVSSRRPCSPRPALHQGPAGDGGLGGRVRAAPHANGRLVRGARDLLEKPDQQQDDDDERQKSATDIHTFLLVACPEKTGERRNRLRLRAASMGARGAVAEWLGRGLQSLAQRFDSARRLSGASSQSTNLTVQHARMRPLRRHQFAGRYKQRCRGPLRAHAWREGFALACTNPSAIHVSWLSSYPRRARSRAPFP